MPEVRQRSTAAAPPPIPPQAITVKQFADSFYSQVQSSDPSYRPLIEFGRDLMDRYPNGLSDQQLVREVQLRAPGYASQFTFSDMPAPPQEEDEVDQQLGPQMGGAAKSLSQRVWGLLNTPVLEPARDAIGTGAEMIAATPGLSQEELPPERAQAQQFERGFYRGLANLGVDLTSPVNAGMALVSLTKLPLKLMGKAPRVARIGQMVIAGGFSASMLEELAKDAPAAYKAYKAGDMNAAGEHLAKSFGELVLGVQAGKAALGQGTTKLKSGAQPKPAGPAKVTHEFVDPARIAPGPPPPAGRIPGGPPPPRQLPPPAEPVVSAQDIAAVASGSRMRPPQMEEIARRPLREVQGMVDEAQAEVNRLVKLASSEVAPFPETVTYQVGKGKGAVTRSEPGAVSPEMRRQIRDAQDTLTDLQKILGLKVQKAGLAPSPPTVEIPGRPMPGEAPPAPVAAPPPPAAPVPVAAAPAGLADDVIQGIATRHGVTLNEVRQIAGQSPKSIGDMATSLQSVRDSVGSKKAKQLNLAGRLGAMEEVLRLRTAAPAPLPASTPPVPAAAPTPAPRAGKTAAGTPPKPRQVAASAPPPVIPGPVKPPLAPPAPPPDVIPSTPKLKAGDQITWVGNDGKSRSGQVQSMESSPIDPTQKVVVVEQAGGRTGRVPIERVQLAPQPAPAPAVLPVPTPKKKAGRAAAPAPAPAAAPPGYVTSPVTGKRVQALTEDQAREMFDNATLGAWIQRFYGQSGRGTWQELWKRLTAAQTAAIASAAKH